jgi:hypothetical protein
MKRIIISIIIAVAVAPRLVPAQSIDATIDATQIRPPITKYMYGQFLEHLGNIINTDIWAEMLDDRKFYNTATSRIPVQAAGAPRGRGFLRRWTPIGLRADERDGIMKVMLGEQQVGKLNMRDKPSKLACHAEPAVATLPTARHGTRKSVTHVPEQPSPMSRV